MLERAFLCQLKSWRDACRDPNVRFEMEMAMRQAVCFGIGAVGVADLFTPKTVWFHYFPNAFFIAVPAAYQWSRRTSKRAVKTWAERSWRLERERDMETQMALVQHDLRRSNHLWNGSSFKNR